MVYIPFYLFTLSGINCFEQALTGTSIFQQQEKLYCKIRVKPVPFIFKIYIFIGFKRNFIALTLV